MAGKLTIDKRMATRKGVIRVQIWMDPKSRKVTGYSFAYINHNLMAEDHGRVLGFDDAHWYDHCTSEHHMHWFGEIRDNVKHASAKLADERFNRFLSRLKQHYGKDY